jgi:hypothetical protein
MPVSALWRAIVKVKQRWCGCVTKSLLGRVPPCSRRHVKRLVTAPFAVVITHQPALARVVVMARSP